MLLQRRVSTCVGHLQVITSVFFWFLFSIFIVVLLSSLICFGVCSWEILCTALSYLPGYCSYVPVWRWWLMWCGCVRTAAYFQVRLRDIPSLHHLRDPKQGFWQAESTKYDSQIYVIRKTSYCQPSVI